ncbi:MAG: c-type cytochrome [Acidobacteriota bacterium]
MKRNIYLKLAAIAVVLGGILSVTAYSSINANEMAANADPALASGAEIYANNCARCHGDDGEGDKGPALNSAKNQAKFKANPQSLINKISNGGGKMPKFKTRLTASDIRAVAQFVKTL